MNENKIQDSEAPQLRDLFVYNLGFLWQKHLRTILSSDGYRVKWGLANSGDLIGIWGVSPTSYRGRYIAKKRNAKLVYIEDAFLRSMRPGRAGEAPFGLLIDHRGNHFDASAPTDLETLLNTHPLDNTNDLARASYAMDRIIANRLSKYSAHDPDAPVPEPGYILVIDQTDGDASVRASAGGRARFLEMLACARRENPGKRILIKTHPETQNGSRSGHYKTADAGEAIDIYDHNIAPMTLLEGAHQVYTLSSQMGFEAIIAGHKPRVFGTPFYAGWGLSEDDVVIPRRSRRLTREQLFLAAMIYYPVWVDPYQETRCELEDILSALEAQTRGWLADYKGWTVYGVRLWKKGFFQRYFGRHKRVVFANSKSTENPSKRPTMVWGTKPLPDEFSPNTPVTRVEDGFIRSRGLGAKLVPPLSLVTDRQGLYFDPSRASDLETAIIHAAETHNPDQTARARRIMHAIAQKGLTKYNVEGQVPDLPNGRRILVTGQVEDDASILLGCPDHLSNETLLRRARHDNPDAVILWKPHPDVEAGLRPGLVPKPDRFADVTLVQTPISALYPVVQEVWTMTSLAGFEALLRGCRVTTLGVPFYAGWGLTQDLGPVPDRRLLAPRPSLEDLVYATLVTYPRYWDPMTGLPCPVETVLDRLAKGSQNGPNHQGPLNATLAKAQGLLASYAYLWR